MGWLRVSALGALALAAACTALSSSSDGFVLLHSDRYT
jgi:hypothetical protein